MGLILPSSERQTRPLAHLSPDEQREAWALAVESAPLVNGKPQVTGAIVTNAIEGYDGDEWFTPAKYIQAAKDVMGGIDLDPATCESAQAQICASTYYTKEDDGLAQEWHGRVWLNPPYSMPLIARFVDKAIGEYEAGHAVQAVVLVNNSSDTKWFHRLLGSFPACFTKGRLPFWRPNHPDFATRQGQVFFYLGPDVDRFYEVFSQFGIVVVRYDY